jgi:hypothetical protein
MNNYEQGLVGVRERQAATFGMPSKQGEQRELLASPEIGEPHTKQAMRVVEVCKEKHATLSLTRRAPVR